MANFSNKQSKKMQMKKKSDENEFHPYSNMVHESNPFQYRERRLSLVKLMFIVQLQ